MKTTLVAIATTALGAMAMASSSAALADASRIGDSVTIGCTLPVGKNGSVVYSIDNQNQLGNEIEFTPNLAGIGKSCSQTINQLTPKTENTTILSRIILNCGPIGGILNGTKLGVWQAAGQTAANPFFPNPAPGTVVGGVASVLLAAQSAAPGPAQPVLLAPPSGDYALVSYTFVCALDVGNLSLFAVNATQAP